VIECRFRQWCEGRVAEALWEVRGWGVYGDVEGLVIRDSEAFELIDAFFCLALVGRDGVSSTLRISDGSVACLHERFRGHISAIGELPVLQGDGELGIVVVGLNRLRNFVVGLTIGVVANQSGEDRINNLAAAGFIGVGGNQRVLRLSAIGENIVVASGRAAVGGSSIVG